jgi:hypothetical protein
MTPKRRAAAAALKRSAMTPQKTLTAKRLKTLVQTKKARVSIADGVPLSATPNAASCSAKPW